MERYCSTEAYFRLVADSEFEHKSVKESIEVVAIENRL